MSVEPLVSIIVPVYNAVANLERCVDSLVAQTHQNLEILLVDDGSTDESGEVCDLYHVRDDRVRALHGPNRGVSVARNIGIGASKGEFIQFVDADDVVEPNMSALLVAGQQATNADLVVTGYIEVEEASGFQRSYGLVDSKVFARREFLAIFPELRDERLINYCWNKLFLSSIIGARGLRFTEGVSYGEDELFVLEYLDASDRVSILADTPYRHVSYASGESLSSRYHPGIYEFAREEMQAIGALLRDAPPHVILEVEKRHALKLVTEIVPYLALGVSLRNYGVFARIAREIKADERFQRHGHELQADGFRNWISLALFRGSRYELIYVFAHFRLRLRRAVWTQFWGKASGSAK